MDGTGASASPGNESAGYKLDEINKLIDQICGGYKEIGEAMANNWKPFHTTFQNNWVGPDADDNENDLIDNIYQIYAKCREGVDMLADKISSVGRFWVDFTEKNLGRGGQTTGKVGSVNMPELEKLEVNLSSIIIKNEPKDWSNLSVGLKDANAARIVSNALDTYVDEVYTMTTNYYASFDANRAFFGEQKLSIDDYLTSMSANLAKLTTCQKTIREMLQRMAQNWVEADAQVRNILQTDADTSNERFDFKDENLR